MPGPFGPFGGLRSPTSGLPFGGLPASGLPFGPVGPVGMRMFGLRGPTLPNEPMLGVLMRGPADRSGGGGKSLIRGEPKQSRRGKAKACRACNPELASLGAHGVSPERIL